MTTEVELVAAGELHSLDVWELWRTCVDGRLGFHVVMVNAAGDSCTIELEPDEMFTFLRCVSGAVVPALLAAPRHSSGALRVVRS